MLTTYQFSRVATPSESIRRPGESSLESSWPRSAAGSVDAIVIGSAWRKLRARQVRFGGVRVKRTSGEDLGESKLRAGSEILPGQAQNELAFGISGWQVNLG